MRRALCALTAACLLAGVLAATASAQPASARVQVIDFQYTPSATTIAVGGTVEWVWDGSSQHTVTARDGSFDEQRERNGRFSFVFRTAGRFEYFCRIHPEVMVATVTVQAPSASPAASPAPTSARPSPTPTSARPSPSSAPTSARPSPATPSSLPSPTTAAPSPTPSPSASAAVLPSSPSASPGRSVVPPTSPLPSAEPLGTLDEPRPKDRTGLAIALALVVAAAGFGLGGTLLLQGRLRTLPADPE